MEQARTFAGRRSSSSAGVDFIKSLVTEMAERSRRSAAATEMTERSRASAAQAAVEPSVGVIIAWAGSDGFDRGDYEPAKVWIGPFHRGKQCPTSESVKMDALHRLLPGDADDQRRERKLRHYLEMVGKMEPGVRGCYSRSFSEITAEEFTCMLLVDGCFLLTRFLQGIAPPRPPQQPVDDIDNIRVDRDIIFLVENQLPFFVLLEIHKLIAPAAAAENHDLVIDSVIGRLKALVGRSAYSAATVSRPSSTPPHILHLLHMFFKPTTAPRPTNGTAAPPASASTEMQQLLPCTLGAANGNAAANETEGTPVRHFCRVVTSYYASCVRYMKKKVGGTPSVALANRRWSSATYYHAAGVSFMPRKVGAGDGEAQSILDVELRGSTLHVPCLTVDSNTFRMLRNMVALEQHTSGKRLSKSHVTTYCFFLSQLAGTEKDVELLVAKKIIVHLLQDAKQVAKGLAGLCDGTVIGADDPDMNYLSEEQDTLEKLCQCGWRKSMAWLRHNKFSNYFMPLAALATIVILVCTIQQSVFAVLSYANRRN